MRVIYFICVLLFSIQCVQADTDNQPPAGVSKEQWQAYQQHKKSWQLMLKNRFETELKDSPPPPPWVKYPSRERASMFWRMGDGEAYLSDYVAVYLRYATKEEIAAYKFKYPEPENWSGWYSNH